MNWQSTPGQPHNNQEQWQQLPPAYRQPEQHIYDLPTAPLPVLPPMQFQQVSQSPKQQPLWKKYRISKKAQIISVLVAILVLVSSLFSAFLVQRFHTPIKADVTVSFGVQDQLHSIHTQFGVAGAGRGTFSQVIDQATPYLAPAHITLASYIVQMEDIFRDPGSLTNPAKRDWSTFDFVMSKIQATSHANPLVTLQGTPAWLQPQSQKPPAPNYCLSDVTRQMYPFHAFPTHRTAKGDDGLALYSQLPVIILAHMNQSFPGIHPNYELWNEPDDDKHAWCGNYTNHNGDEMRFSWYKAIYSTAAPLMKAQARVDHTQVSLGGPTLAWYARVDSWMPRFLNDPQLSPYIDFVTYHQYAPGTDWNSILSKTQDAQIGYAATYEKVSRYVHAGKQPHAQTTPIYIGEYNCSALCRTNPIYSPLWNTLFVADLLNTVNDAHTRTDTAFTLPAGLAYWAWSLGPYCLFGAIDAKLDCSTKQGQLQPYPAYYSYLLLGGKNYLDLADGGYVANVTAMTQKGLVATSFSTKTKENVLVVNPTGQNYLQLVILIAKSALVKTNASYYTLNQANAHISSQELSLSSASNGNYVTINIAPYSTFALSLDISS